MRLYFRFSVVLFLLVCFCVNSYAQASYPLNSDQASIQWKVKAQSEIKEAASDVFQAGANAVGWVNAVVPGTVFNSYVLAGLEKDPNFGDNIYKVDKSKYDRNFWYRAEFRFPDELKGEKIWLNFRGVNRKAEVFLNGIRVGSLDGFMQRGKFDVTSILVKDKVNVLAVLVYCPKTPIANHASPTYISSAGWDWMPYVPGLNMGITDKVFLSSSGQVTLADPWVRTEELTQSGAELSLAVTLQNHSDKELKGVLSGTINPGNIQFSQNVNVPPGQTQMIQWTKKNVPQLSIANPLLWWPNGYGTPNLYTCELAYRVDEKVSDERKISFGIRKYSYDSIGGVMHISINGTRIFLKEGNWGMSEYMLRCRGAEYETKLRLHKEINFNIIRNWIGSTTDEEFYDACDKYGLMVWDDFWLNSHPNLPDDVFAFNENAVEKIKRLRNHPCIALWCGDNEGYPLPPLNGWLREDVKTFDGGDRWYHPNSHSDALTGSGIWTNLEPKDYFAQPPLGFGGTRGWGLRSEIGTAVFTTFDSFKKFMPKEYWWPQNELWDKHFFGPSAANAGPDRYMKGVNRYGEPSGIEDFCKKAQFLNLETNKAMYEGWHAHMWNDASGILTWMSQSAYPSMVWQTYDYYYDLTGAYWGAKKACEPIHILWNCADNSIMVSNTSSSDLENSTAEVFLYNKDGKEVKGFRQSKIVSVPKNSAQSCCNINFDLDNLAYKKIAFASSCASESGKPSDVTDGGDGTRWSSQYLDNQWVCVDLGTVTEFSSVSLLWEGAHAKSYKIQVSNDTVSWNDVYTNTDSKGGKEEISFAPVKARYVRMLGLQRATAWGFSLWEFKVYHKKNNILSDIHFIRLDLKDAMGRVLSDNFYWRGNKDLDYSGINSLPNVCLKISYKSVKKNGKYFITAQISNPRNSPALAFGIRVNAIKAKTGEQILPVFMDDNYFSLIQGETKAITLEFDASLLGNDELKLIAEPFNSL